MGERSRIDEHGEPRFEDELRAELDGLLEAYGLLLREQEANPDDADLKEAIMAKRHELGVLAARERGVREHRSSDDMELRRAAWTHADNLDRHKMLEEEGIEEAREEGRKRKGMAFDAVKEMADYLEHLMREPRDARVEKTATHAASVAKTESEAIEALNTEICELRSGIEEVAGEIMVVTADLPEFQRGHLVIEAFGQLKKMREVLTWLESASTVEMLDQAKTILGAIMDSLVGISAKARMLH